MAMTKSSKKFLLTSSLITRLGMIASLLSLPDWTDKTEVEIHGLRLRQARVLLGQAAERLLFLERQLAALREQSVSQQNPEGVEEVKGA